MVEHVRDRVHSHERMIHRQWRYRVDENERAAAKAT